MSSAYLLQIMEEKANIQGIYIFNIVPKMLFNITYNTEQTIVKDSPN
jgi:hypothetical protein